MLSVLNCEENARKVKLVSQTYKKLRHFFAKRTVFTNSQVKNIFGIMAFQSISIQNKLTDSFLQIFPISRTGKTFYLKRYPMEISNNIAFPVEDMNDASLLVD